MNILEFVIPIQHTTVWQAKHLALVVFTVGQVTEITCCGH